MTNQEIIELAKNKGFEAKLINGYGYTTKVLISLTGRKPNISEVSFELDLPSSYFYPHHKGVTIYGSDN